MLVMSACVHVVIRSGGLTSALSGAPLMWGRARTAQGERPEAGLAPHACSAMASASLLPCPAQAMASLRAGPEAFPVPLAHGLCSTKHGEAVGIHGAEKRMEKFAQLLWECGRKGVPVMLGSLVSGNGTGSAGMSLGEAQNN